MRLVSLHHRLGGRALAPCAILCLLSPLTVAAQTKLTPQEDLARMHDSVQWKAIQEHLPNPATASSHDLEMQADILRARRFPQDALDYYRYALDRGGKPAELLNKAGLTELEMKNVELARADFNRVVRMSKKDANAWNNLGAVEYLDGKQMNAIADYKRAVKLEKTSAIFHSNLGTSYFEEKDYKSARREIATALRLDPEIFNHPSSSTGVSAHLLSSADRARMSFEMARLYAERGAVDQMMHSLAMASEAGLDIRREIRRDPLLLRYENDPQVEVMIHNAEALKPNRAETASAVEALPTLPTAKPLQE